MKKPLTSKRNWTTPQAMFGISRGEKRLKALEEDFEKLRRKQDGIELEWGEVLDKVKRLMWRIGKRAEADAEALNSEKAALGTTPAAATNPAAIVMDPISARILARRGNRHLLRSRVPETQVVEEEK